MVLLLLLLQKSAQVTQTLSELFIIHRNKCDRALLGKVCLTHAEIVWKRVRGGRQGVRVCDFGEWESHTRTLLRQMLVSHSFPRKKKTMYYCSYYCYYYCSPKALLETDTKYMPKYTKIYGRLTAVSENLICEEQCGFRVGRSWYIMCLHFDKSLLSRNDFFVYPTGKNRFNMNF